MNTYDPADYITYVPMDRQFHPSVSVGPSDAMENHLPEGYANASPKTRLRSRAAIPVSQFDGQPLQRLAARIGPGYPVWSPRTSGTA